jgi:hypothetical protein
MEKGCDFVNDLKFEISQVHAGWFVCLIGDVEIWASYIQMHDSPRQLLKLLGELMSGEREQGCVVFDEEPGCYILSIQRGERDSFSLGFTEKNFQDFYPQYPDEAAVLPVLSRTADGAGAVCETLDALPNGRVYRTAAYSWGLFRKSTDHDGLTHCPPGQFHPAQPDFTACDFARRKANFT